jgi:hypothetical protein
MIHVLFKFAKNPYGGIEVDVTSNSGFWKDLSPFLLDAAKYGARNFENLWQFSKVYKEHIMLIDGLPNWRWYRWRDVGYANPKAIRYPMGKGAKPEYLLWNGEKLGYIEARKAVYAPIYAELVKQTQAYGTLNSLYESLYDDGLPLVLRDYDAYDHIAMGRTLKDAINDPNRKCGHGFVLAMMLVGELERCLE